MNLEKDSQWLHEYCRSNFIYNHITFISLIHCIKKTIISFDDMSFSQKKRKISKVRKV